MTPAIEVRDLVVDRGNIRALDHVSAEIPRGEVTGLLGPSGSGKTTLMRAIVGVQVIKQGEVRVLGGEAGSRDARRRVGYLTQSPSVYADLTVRENVRYFASLYRLGRAAADEAIDRVGLTEAAKQLVGALSGGQHSRASLACALVGRPELLVLDEPTVGQDPVLRDELWKSFRQYAAEGTTIVVSSHVMDEADRCDRLLLIRAGELIADDTPAGVRAAAGLTDTAELDAAFLALIRRQAAASPAVRESSVREPSGGAHP